MAAERRELAGGPRLSPGRFLTDSMRVESPERPGDRLGFERVLARNTIAAYFHTGGTTGAPKLARHTHYNQVSDALLAATVLDLSPEDTLLCGLPVFHVNEMVIPGPASFLAGARVVLVGSTGYRNKAAVKSFWKIVEVTEATVFSAVPS